MLGKELLDSILDNYPDEEILSADGLDDAIIGLEMNSMKLIYSVSKCLEKFVEDGMTEDEAIEYFEYNVFCAYVGDHTPIWCYDDF